MYPEMPSPAISRDLHAWPPGTEAERLSKRSVSTDTGGVLVSYSKVNIFVD
jgi:hypothetical protein